MFNLRVIALALGVLSSGVTAQVDSAQCSSLKAIGSAGFSDSASLSAFCTSALSYTVPPAVTTTRTTSDYVTVTKFTTATATATSVVTVTATVTKLTTVFGKRAALPVPAADPAAMLEVRQSLGGLPVALIQQLCDCLQVAHPVTPTRTATLTRHLTSSKTSTVTKTTTTFKPTTVTTTINTTTTVPRITLTVSSPATEPTPTEISWDGLCGSEGDGATCKGSTFGTCCSRFGYCGTGDVYCGSGCQPVFGACN